MKETNCWWLRWVWSIENWNALSNKIKATDNDLVPFAIRKTVDSIQSNQLKTNKCFFVFVLPFECFFTIQMYSFQCKKTVKTRLKFAMNWCYFGRFTHKSVVLIDIAVHNTLLSYEKNSVSMSSKERTVCRIRTWHA